MKIELKNRKYLSLITGVILLLGISALVLAKNDTQRNRMSEETAKELLKKALTDSTLHNVIGSDNVILENENQAITFAELILFDIYGKKEIIKQKPYDVFHIDNYWIISGTLPRNWVGGTFLIIINSIDCRIVLLSHGK